MIDLQLPREQYSAHRHGAGIQYSYFVDRTHPEYKGPWNQPHSVARVFSPQDMLKMYGPLSATYLDMSDQIGTLEKGKLADIVLLDGDPLEGYWNWLRARTVVKAGKVVVEAKR